MSDDKNAKTPTDEEKKLLWPLVLVCVLLVLALAPFLCKFGSLSLSSEYEDWLTFSSYIGNLASPIIALAVLIYVAKTFEVQRKELNATQNELKETREEQVKQTKIQSIQTKINIRGHQISAYIYNKSILESFKAENKEKRELLVSNIIKAMENDHSVNYKVVSKAIDMLDREIEAQNKEMNETTSLIDNLRKDIEKQESSLIEIK